MKRLVQRTEKVELSTEELVRLMRAGQIYVPEGRIHLQLRHNGHPADERTVILEVFGTRDFNTVSED